MKTIENCKVKRKMNVRSKSRKECLDVDWDVDISVFISVKEEPGVREGGIVDNGNNHISDGILSEGRFSDDEDDDSMGKNICL